MANISAEYAAGLEQPFNRTVSLSNYPAMTSSQQDLRNWQQQGTMIPSAGWSASPGGVLQDENYSDRESSVANPLDERFSEPESSVAGEAPFDARADQGISWRPTPNVLPSNGSVQNVPQARLFGHPDSVRSLNSPVDLQTYRTPDMAVSRLSPSANGSQLDMKWRNPDLNEIIDYLRRGNDAVKANAAAYLQHLTYLDDNIKAQTRSLNGIPALVNLISSPITEVHRAACGTLRNLSYGKVNDINKREIKNAGGIEQLVALLRKTTDGDVQEIVTGILWNLSSCADLKKSVIDEGLKTLVDFVVKPAAGWHQTALQLTETTVVGDYRSTVFRNASGVLRNVSSDGDYARRKLRECDGLIDAVIIVVRAAISNGDMDNKSVENCVCVLRNLSYACQEVVDPNYLQKRMPNSMSGQQDETSGCFGGKKKKATSKEPKATQHKAIQSGDPLFRLKEKALWQPEIVQIYLPLLRECTNPDTLEAAAGAIQNLAAGDWQPADTIRTTIRQEKVIPIIIDLLTLNSDRVVCTAATALRNLALDTRNKELIGKYGIPQLVSKLPSSSRPSDVQVLSNDTITAVESALYEIIKTNSTHAKSLMAEGGIERLMCIVSAAPNEFSEKVVKFASQLLVKMWQFTELHDEYKRRGWRQADFLGSSGTGFKSQPASAESTMSRPRQSQSGQGGPGTARIDRQQPPPYVLHGGSTASISRQPYSDSLEPRMPVNSEDRRYTSMEFYPGEQQLEAGQVSRPPVYDAVSNDGAPPGYSYHGNSNGSASRYVNVDTRYGPENYGVMEHSSRSPRMLSNGGGGGAYVRNGGDNSDVRFAPDISFDSQGNASPYSVQDIRDRLSPVDIQLSMRGQGSAVPNVYGDQMRNQYPLDRTQEPVYARVQNQGRFRDDLHFQNTSEPRVNDVDSWV